MAIEERWITTEESALILGRTVRQIRRYAQDNKLESKRDGKALLVEFGSVLNLLKELSGASMNNEEPEPEEAVKNEADIKESEITNEKEEPHPEKPKKALNETENLALEGAKPDIKQLLAALKRTVKREKKYLAQAERLLEHLEEQYHSEQNKDERFQANLKNLLEESQESKPSLRHRLFG